MTKKKKGTPVHSPVQHMTVTTDKDKQIKQINIPDKDGGEDIVVKVEPVDIKPDQKYMLPQETIDGLQLHMTWRDIGSMLKDKIPMFENEPQTIMEAYHDDDEHKIPVGIMPKVYITRYDMIKGERDLVEGNMWCLMMEKNINGKDEAIGMFLSDEVITNVQFIKDRMAVLIKHLNKKFAN